MDANFAAELGMLRGHFSEANRLDDLRVFHRGDQARREPARRKIPMTPIMREEALAAFRAWRDQPGRIEY